MPHQIERYRLTPLMASGLRVEMRQVGPGLAIATVAAFLGGLSWWDGSRAASSGTPQALIGVFALFVLAGVAGALRRETWVCERRHLHHVATPPRRDRRYAGAQLTRVVLRQIPTSPGEAALLPWHVEIEGPAGRLPGSLELQSHDAARQVARALADALQIPLALDR